jgi:23S rRNA maturation-related 3'-5' exoribonuclease YhaM
MSNDHSATKHELLSTKNPGDSFAGVYLVDSVAEKKTSGGKSFSDINIRDRSGVRSLKYWGVIPNLKRGDFIAALIRVETYQGNPSFSSSECVKDDAPSDLSDYVPTYPDVSGFPARFNAFVDKIKALEGNDNTCSIIVEQVFADGYFEKFKNAPGSVSPFYGRIGGSICRTLRVATACDSLATAYGLERRQHAMLLASALLHRSGGAVAFRFDCGMPEYTDDGMLIGVAGLSILRFKTAIDARKKEIDWNHTGRLLMHNIQASIGTNIKPMTIEAILLSMAAKTDLQVSEAMDFIETNGAPASGSFTAFDPTLRRRFYVSEDNRDISHDDDKPQE